MFRFLTARNTAALLNWLKLAVLKQHPVHKRTTRTIAIEDTSEKDKSQNEAAPEFGDVDSDDMSVDMSISGSDGDPDYTPGECEVRRCKQEVFAACTECEIFLGYNHMVEDVISCDHHGKKKRKTVKR